MHYDDATLRRRGEPVDTAVDLSSLNFRYAIEGDAAPWRPLRAFDDGRKVYVEFPRGISQGEMPPLFIIGASGDIRLSFEQPAIDAIRYPKKLLVPAVFDNAPMREDEDSIKFLHRRQPARDNERRSPLRQLFDRRADVILGS